MQWNQKLWQRSLDGFPEFLEPLVAELGRSERREGAALYVQGLLLPGERKSIEPMAERLGIDSQKLQQFIADSPWDEQEVCLLYTSDAADEEDSVDLGGRRII